MRLGSYKNGQGAAVACKVTLLRGTEFAYFGAGSHPVFVIFCLQKTVSYGNELQRFLVREPELAKGIVIVSAGTSVYVRCRGEPNGGAHTLSTSIGLLQAAGATGTTKTFLPNSWRNALCSSFRVRTGGGIWENQEG